MKSLESQNCASPKGSWLTACNPKSSWILTSHLPARYVLAHLIGTYTDLFGWTTSFLTFNHRSVVFSHQWRGRWTNCVAVLKWLVGLGKWQQHPDFGSIFPTSPCTLNQLISSAIDKPESVNLLKCILTAITFSLSSPRHSPSSTERHGSTFINRYETNWQTIKLAWKIIK